MGWPEENVSIEIAFAYSMRDFIDSIANIADTPELLSKLVTRRSIQNIKRSPPTNNCV
jgi:hypothetical protein